MDNRGMSLEFSHELQRIAAPEPDRSGNAVQRSQESPIRREEAAFTRPELWSDLLLPSIEIQPDHGIWTIDKGLSFWGIKSQRPWEFIDDFVRRKIQEAGASLRVEAEDTSSWMKHRQMLQAAGDRANRVPEPKSYEVPDFDEAVVPHDGRDRAVGVENRIVHRPRHLEGLVSRRAPRTERSHVETTKFVPMKVMFRPSEEKSGRPLEDVVGRTVRI